MGRAGPWPSRWEVTDGSPGHSKCICVTPLVVDHMAFELKFTFPVYIHGCGEGRGSMKVSGVRLRNIL